MSITAQQAFTIFSGQLRGEPEAIAAAEALQPLEQEQYLQHAEAFNEAAAKQGIMAQLEMGELVEKHNLLLKPENRAEWKIADWRDFLTSIEGSHFEQLHLNAALGLDTNAVLLELVKP